MAPRPQSHPLSDQVQCEVCMKEVPQSAAVHFETKDYVAHFCGLDCYAQWKGMRDSMEPARESSDK